MTTFTPYRQGFPNLAPLVGPSRIYLFCKYLAHSIGRLQITVRSARIVIVIGKRITVIQKVLHCLDGNGKTGPSPKGIFRVVTPTTSPRKLKSGPPLLPGLIC